MGRSFYSEFIGNLFKQITHIPEFEKDLKKLMKRFSSLEEDLRMFIKVAMNAFQCSSNRGSSEAISGNHRAKKLEPPSGPKPH
jgi:hypothetical protein